MVLWPAALIIALSMSGGQSPNAVDQSDLVKKIQDELASPTTPPEGKPDPDVPHGEILRGSFDTSKIYPGTENPFQIYVPAQYDPRKPACLLIRLDGFDQYVATVLDNLIAHKEIPVMIAVGIVPGAIWKGSPGTPNRQALRYNRSFEFDSVNNRFADFVLTELLPAVEQVKTQDGRPIRLSKDGNDHAATGASTGGIGSFTLAWQRPDQFTRVYSEIGTFVPMRGGNEYPALIRKTDPKPIRIFLEDGATDAWNPLFGSWFEANTNLDSALRFAGYDVAHAWSAHGHDSRPGQAIFPDVMRWLWRDYPKPIQSGVSSNSSLQETLLAGEPWRKVQHNFHTAAALAADAKGDVYFSDPSKADLYRITGNAGPAVCAKQPGGVAGQAFGPDGTLYSVIPAEKKVVAVKPHGDRRTVAEGIAGRDILVTHEGIIYVSEPDGESGPSRIWQISNGAKRLVDEGLKSATGVAFSPDGTLFYAAEKTTKWVYSYIVQPDGSFIDKQPYYWLHMTDLPNDSGAEALALDTKGNLYVATRMGIQVCDQNGRVRAILPLPTPSGPLVSLCFGGPNFDILYATDGKQIFARRLKVRGFAPWSAPIAVPSQGPA